MKWICDNCGSKLSGKEEYCPKCSAKIHYRCKNKNCNKELDNGEFFYCPICKTEMDEKKEKLVKGLKYGALALGSVALTIITRGNWKKT